MLGYESGEICVYNIENKICTAIEAGHTESILSMDFAEYTMSSKKKKKKKKEEEKQQQDEETDKTHNNNPEDNPRQELHNKIHDEYHFSLSKGDLKSTESPLVRVQTQSILQDTLGINELGKNWSIRDSLKRISDEGTGLFVLINYKDAKSYWLNKLEEKEIEPKSNRRVIGVGSQILRALDLKKITVLGTPTKYNAVSGFDIEITGFVND